MDLRKIQMAKKKWSGYKKKWKVVPCFVGESCWCRIIVTENYDVRTDRIEDTVIGSGEVCEDMAKHIAGLHNNTLISDKTKGTNCTCDRCMSD